MNENLYVVTVIFNPMQFKSRIKLYNEFAPYIEWSGAKLFTVEVALEGHPFEVTSPTNPNHMQLRTKDVLWHKERGLNLGIAKVIEQYPDAQNIAWIDADVRFSDPHWVRNTVLALRHYNVIQPFSQAQFLKYNTEQYWITQSMMKKWSTKGYTQKPPIPLKYISGGHPGLAWAARRDVLEGLGGLIDFCIAGSGDTHMANAFKGDINLFFKPGMSKGFKQALTRWKNRSDKYVRGNMGYIDGICSHYWHGASDKRGYIKRWDIMLFQQFDPYEDIYLGLNGLYKFTGNKPDMEYDIRKTMTERDEDANA
jgi:hypothetical protein